MRQSKEDDCRRFIGEYNASPWGKLQICEGKRSREMSGIKVNGKAMLPRPNSVCVLLGQLFPRSDTSMCLGKCAQGKGAIPPRSVARSRRALRGSGFETGSGMG